MKSLHKYNIMWIVVTLLAAVIAASPGLLSFFFAETSKTTIVIADGSAQAPTSPGSTASGASRNSGDSPGGGTEESPRTPDTESPPIQLELEPMFTLIPGHSKAVDFAKATFSVTFQNLDGEKFATLRVFPEQSEPVTKAVVAAGAIVDFVSQGERYRATVVDLNLTADQMSIRVDKK